MALDGITIANITKELKDQLSDGRISKIAQPENDELLITVKTPSGQKRLCISASASLPLIYLTKENKTSPMNAPNFCMLLRKHIGNGRITNIQQPRLERVIQFDIEHLDELGDLCKKLLIVEIMGKHSNIIFCRQDGTIIDSIKHVSSQMSSVREVLPGRPYFIPDTMGKADPLVTDKETFTSLLSSKPMPLGKALYTSFTGVSPIVAEEICCLSGIESERSAKDLSTDSLLHFYNQFRIFFEQVQQADFHPCIYYDGDTPREFSAIPLTHFQQFRRQDSDSMSYVLEHYYAAKNISTRIRQKSVDLRKVVTTALERNRKKYDLQQKQLRDTANRDQYKIYGELIHTYGYDLTEGAKKLEALNYYTNERITIPLDSTKSAGENAQKYFDRYNKQKRTAEALESLLTETQEDIQYLESISNALDIALSEDDLTQIKEELIQAGYIRRKYTKKKIKITSRPFHYISSDGFHMYVGKNNLQNDELTFQFATGSDWWFHAKGIPGSHVILKSEGKELPDRAFEEAGKLAAYYSRNRGSDKIEIDYVEKKHVKKPKGGKPGFVVYYTNYSFVMDSDIRAIQQAE